MRDHLLTYINGTRYEIRGSDAFLSLSDFLRHRGLTGTKIVCSEGDCGSCTVLVGRPKGDALQYESLDSCIQFMFQLDGTHVVSVEGLCNNGALTPVQQAMVDCHGSQCGFCTPGFVVAMSGMLESADALTEARMRYGLTGNLCRCTGYVPIFEAGESVRRDQHQNLNDVYPPDEIVWDITESATDSVRLAATIGESQHRLCAADTLDDALAFLANHNDARIVAGATDIGVQVNKSRKLPATLLVVNSIEELKAVTIDNDELTCGAGASWTAIEHACHGRVPQFHEVLTLFGSPQIRNAGTIGGNIANASPIADSLPFMFVMNAIVELASSSGTREVNINEFYRGYKDFDLQPGELISRVRIPLPAEGELLELYKVSRRRDLDISGFTGAVRMRLAGQHVADVAIAFGAVGPTVIRARETEEFLVGQEFTEQTMRAAGDVAVGEVAPISDVRGSADYRLQLTRNVLVKFYHQSQQHLATV